MAGPRLIVAAHLIGSTGSHADVTSLYPPRWQLPVSDPADGPAEIRQRVRREHKYGSDWIKTTNAGGYFSPGDDPARVTWFDEEMQAVCDTAAQLGMPVAVHTGAAQACKQAIRCGARSLEHAYLIDEEGLELAEQAGVYVVPTMQMTPRTSTNSTGAPSPSTRRPSSAETPRKSKASIASLQAA